MFSLQDDGCKQAAATSSTTEAEMHPSLYGHGGGVLMLMLSGEKKWEEEGKGWKGRGVTSRTKLQTPVLPWRLVLLAVGQSNKGKAKLSCCHHRTASLTRENTHKSQLIGGTC